MKHLFLLALAVLTGSCNSDLQNASVNAGDVYVSGNSQNPQLPQLSFDAWFTKTASERKFSPSLKEALKLHFEAKGFMKEKRFDEGLKDFGF